MDRVVVTSPPAPAARLRALRQAAALSQEELSERSGISERTIRALESGRARRPHRDTLVAIAVVLGVPDDDRDAFVASWRTATRRLARLFAAASPEEELLAEFTRQRSLLQELAVASHVQIRADRRWDRSIVRRTFEVVGDGVDRLLWMASFAPETVDPARFEVRDCVNVDPGVGVHIPTLHAKAWEGLLRRTLSVGEIYSLEYTLDYGSAARPGDAQPESDSVSLTGLFKPVHSLHLGARFDPAALPGRVVRIWMEAVGATEQVVAELPVSPFGIAEVFVEPAVAGTHGIRWFWD